MSTAAGDKFDYFLSRRGSVATVAQEVENVLAEKGYSVFVQDYDIALGASFIEAMHEAIKQSRDLVILFTGDYEASPFTRKEFTSFEADRHHGGGERQVVILRCEDVPLRGLLADNVYQDLVGVTDPNERRRRIIAAVERQSAAQRPARRRGKTFVGVPPRIAGFTGRADALERVDAILTSDQPVAVTQLGRAAVQGMGGVGKTSLVVEYAHRYRNLYDGVWWCPAETRASLLTSLAALAVELDAASPEEAGIEAAARAALRRLSEQRDIWLLVYDNVSTPEDIADLLPAGVARVLITSRFSDWSAWADEVSLDVLPIEEAMAFLQDRAGLRDDDGARLLAEALGRLPLALDHAAATCKRTQMGFAAYATKASSLISAAPRGAGYPRSVAATFDLAIDDAAGRCPAAEALMEYLTQCAPERIPMTLIEGAIDDETARMDALAALCEVSLVKHDPFDDGAPAVTVHRLVQAVVRARSNANANAQHAARRVLERLAATYPGDGNINAASWPRCASLTPHLLAICAAPEIGEGTQARRANLLTRAGDYFYGRGAYAAARPCYEGALAIHEAIRGPAHPSTAKSLNKLAPLLQTLGDLAGARALYERALEIREHALGPEHADTATSLLNLASLLREQGELARARPLLERALAIYEKVRGPEHPATAGGLRYLANLRRQQGDLAGARPLLERSVAIYEKLRGADHPSTARCLNHLASLLRQQGELAAARSLSERALVILEKSLGPEHPDTAWSLGNMANLIEAEGDHAGAQGLYERALAIWEKLVGAAHPNTHRVRGDFARWLLAGGNAAQALAYGEAALAVHRQALREGHPWIKDSAAITAAALDALGRTEEAAGLWARFDLATNGRGQG
jgi:tetratricopeptide (TPR) repeat protein